MNTLLASVYVASTVLCLLLWGWAVWDALSGREREYPRKLVDVAVGTAACFVPGWNTYILVAAAVRATARLRG